jgi:hypothetical protein
VAAAARVDGRAKPDAEPGPETGGELDVRPASATHDGGKSQLAHQTRRRTCRQTMLRTRRSPPMPPHTPRQVPPEPELDRPQRTHTPRPPQVCAAAAHVLARVVSVRPSCGHLLLECATEEAYVRADRWSGKTLEPQREGLPPILTFFGSQRFGHVVPALGPAPGTGDRRQRQNLRGAGTPGAAWAAAAHREQPKM